MPLDWCRLGCGKVNHVLCQMDSSKLSEKPVKRVINTFVFFVDMISTVF